VTTVSAHDVWIAGVSSTGTQAFLAHWDGQNWTPSSVTGPGLYSNELVSIAAVSSREVWAVGSFSQVYGVHQALIELYFA
jgi:hypothetical protein